MVKKGGNFILFDFWPLSKSEKVYFVIFDKLGGCGIFSHNLKFLPLCRNREKSCDENFSQLGSKAFFAGSILFILKEENPKYVFFQTFYLELESLRCCKCKLELTIQFLK